MKKRLLTATMAVLCLALAGCTQLEKKNENGETGIVYQDRAIYELKGKVQAVRATTNISGVTEPSYDLCFEKNGKCTKHRLDGTWEEKDMTYTAEHNSNGQVVRYTAKSKSEETAKVEYRYFYDEKGRLAKTNSMWYGETIVTESYEYDEEGNTTRFEREIIDSDYPTIKESVYYRNRKSDSYGNWTEREGLIIVEEKGNRHNGTDLENTFVEKRDIIYFE